jgi:HPt (histidine-containing phosphotransfer) domain-containing protein
VIAPAIDEKVLADLIRSLGDRAAEVLRLWLDTLDDRVAAIRAGAMDMDRQALAIAAHTLRGSASYVGASRLTDTCAEIERRLNAGMSAAAALHELVGRVERDAADAAEVLRALPALRE